MSNYPPGTPGPKRELGEVTCAECEETSPVTATHDLGMTDWRPEECPHCGAPWPADAELEPYDPADFEPDRREDVDY